MLKISETAGMGWLSKVSLFIDDNKRVISTGFYILGFAGLLKIGSHFLIALWAGVVFGGVFVSYP